MYAYLNIPLNKMLSCQASDDSLNRLTVNSGTFNRINTDEMANGQVKIVTQNIALSTKWFVVYKVARYN